jgi:hypothetical protein
MAVSDKSTGTSAAGRRWFFGTNVLVVVLLVVFVVVGLNWIGQRHNKRRDMAGGFSGTQLSDRAKQVLAKAPADLRITTVYTSDEPETDRRKYYPKVQDLCREISQFNKQVKVQHLYGGNERAELRNEVQKKFGAAAGKYNEVITQTTGVWEDLQKNLAPMREDLEKLMKADDSWLSGFTTFANMAAVLRKDSENIDQTRKEIDGLVRGEGLPRYQEANTKIKTANEDLKKHLEDMQKLVQDTQKLAKVLQDPKSEFASKTRERAKELDGMLAELRKAAGDPKDANVPDDPKPLLQDFAKSAIKLSNWLNEETSRVNTFARAYPALRQHPKWLVQAQTGPFVTQMELSSILTRASQDLTGAAQQLRQYIKENVPKDQLQNLVRQIRGMAADEAEQLVAWNTSVIALLNEGAKLQADGPDLKFLAQGSSGEMFKPVLDKLNDIATKIAELPALKMDEIATKLQQDNIVVVQTDKEVRVLTFDELWPLADRMDSQFGPKGDDEKGTRRVFAGDSPITSAVLALQNAKPFATVIFVTYESEPNPQMRQFSRGKNTGPIPMEQITTLKEKLEAANFKVKEWNLGGEAEAAKRPEPEEGTKAVYVVLPPAPKPPQQQFGMGGPEKGFGEAEIAKVKEVLAKEGNALFIACFQPPGGMFAPPSSYEYQQYLQSEWGIDVEQNYLVIRGVVDPKAPGKYGINPDSVNTVLNSFSDQPIGKPLRSRRMLMNAVCPVLKAAAVPAGVTLQTVLEIPATARNFWAESDIGRIVRGLRAPDGTGGFTKSADSKEPPFPIILAAENANTKSRILVAGNGNSMLDHYLTQRVIRLEGKQHRLVTDPPPTENVDLFLNSVCWLSGHPELIAAGPAEVPVVPVISPKGQQSLWLVSVGWAFAVLVAGGVVMMVRRK